MKRVFRFLSLALCCLLSVAAFGCYYGGSLDDLEEEEVPEQLETDTEEERDWIVREPAQVSDFLNKTLNIKFFNGGYGKKWIEAMKEKFEAEYPGITVVLKPTTDSAQFQSLIADNLSGTPDDIYICHDIPWQDLGDNGLIADLTNELYNKPIYYDAGNDMQPIKFLDLVANSSLASTMFNKKHYKVPLIQGAGGIAYNKTMFDANGWTIPETYADLVALCETIANGNYKDGSGNKIYPFVFSGTESYLWDAMIYEWWMQLAGMDQFLDAWNVKNYDMNYYNPETYPYHKQAYQAWYDLVCVNKAKYCVPGSDALSYLDADIAFAYGTAAMMPATCWISNEIDVVLEGEKKELGVEIGLMSAPFLPDAKKDGDGNYIKTVYDTAGRDSIVIAEKGNKALAVEFMRWLALEENNSLFPKNVDGICMGFKYNYNNLIENVAKDQWAKDCFAILRDSQRSVGYSSNLLFIYKKTSEYPLGNYRLQAYQSIGTSNVITPDSIFNQTWTYTQAGWSDWLKAIGIF